MVRPETIQKVNRIQKFIQEGMTVQAACRRVDLSEAWFYKIRRQLRADQTISLIDPEKK